MIDTVRKYATVPPLFVLFVLAEGLCFAMTALKYVQGAGCRVRVDTDY